MQIGVISNRPPIREKFSRTIREFIDTSCLDLEVQCFDNQRSLLIALTAQPLEVLFYDTEQVENMEDKVWEVMHSIPTCSLVLTGDDTRHAVFGYAVRAMDYLTTPVDEEDLLDCLARMLRKRMEAKNQFLPVRICGVWTRVSTDKMVYMESMGHSLVFHMDDGVEFKMIANFRDYASLLNLNRNFFRCHKSYMVNMKYVSALESKELLLKTGESLNISRTYSQEARSVYADYVAENYTKELLAEVASVPLTEPAQPKLQAPSMGRR